MAQRRTKGGSDEEPERYILREGMMKIKNLVTGEVFDAELRTDVSASSYGQPVLCIRRDDGTFEQVDRWSYQIIEE